MPDQYVWFFYPAVDREPHISQKMTQTNARAEARKYTATTGVVTHVAKCHWMYTKSDAQEHAYE